MAIDIINKVVNTDTAVLVAQTALSLDATMKDFKRAILLTHCQVIGVIAWPTIVDELIIGLAYGDATIAQIAAAIVNATVDKDDGQAYRVGQTAERAVIDFFAPTCPQVATQRTAVNWKPRLPKGGIPSGRNNGFKTFAFNVDDSNAFTDGPTLKLITKWIFADMEKS